MLETVKSAKLAETTEGTEEMEMFAGYAWQQFALGNEAKVNAFVGLALDVVAKVQGWNEGEKRKSKAECESALSIALTIAKVPETSARRYLATVSGLVTRFGSDFRAMLESIRAEMVKAEAPIDAAEAVSIMRAALTAEGVESLGFLETYARKGKPGIAALAAEFAAKAEARAKAESMTEAEAAEAAKAEAEAAEAAKADASPRAKAAKQAAAILASIAKHSDNMTDAELTAIASAVAEIMAKRRGLAAAARMESAKVEAAEARGKASIAASDARMAAAA